MGAGPNHLLDKGYKATGTAAYVYGQPVTFAVAQQSCVGITVADAFVLGVCQENIDAERVKTGKAVIGIRTMGMSRVIIGAAVAKGDPLTVNALGKFVKQATAGGKFYAVAEEAGTAADQLVEVRLTGTYATI